MASDLCHVHDLIVAPLRYAVVRLAWELGVFELLRQGPREAEEIRRRLELSERGAAALLAVLRAEQLLIERRGQLCLSSAARDTLVRGARYDMNAFLATGEAPTDWMRQAMRSEDPPVGARLLAWEKGETLGDVAASTKRMHALTSGVAARMAELVDLRGVRRLLDVGGGSGASAIALARWFPRLRVTIFDLPKVCQAARSFLRKASVASRVALAPGDMFADPWPAPHDAVFFSNILHDWTDEQCLGLFTKARLTLAPGGRVLVHEMLLDEQGGPLTAALFSFMMLATTRGRQRSARELTKLAKAAGLGQVTVRATDGYASLLSATKPKSR
jgi:acetylserotonin N-methyltransferase